MRLTPRPPHRVELVVGELLSLFLREIEPAVDAADEPVEEEAVVTRATIASSDWSGLAPTASRSRATYSASSSTVNFLALDMTGSADRRQRPLPANAV